MFSFLFGIYLGMELLSYWVEGDNSSQSSCTILHILQQCMRVPVASHLCQLWCCRSSLVLAIQVRV